MITVGFHRTHLQIVLPEERVFWHEYPPACPQAEVLAVKTKTRYAAYDARLNRDSEYVYEVYEVGGAGREGFAIVNEREYDPLHPPMAAKSRETDEEEERHRQILAKASDERKARQEAKDRKRNQYLWMPATCGGVNWGCESRILAYTKRLMVVYRPGHTSYLDRGAGNVYSSGQMTLFDCKIENGKPVYAGRNSPLSLGKDFKLPPGFRYSPKHLLPMVREIAHALGVHSDRFCGWRGETTLNLTE